MKGYVKHLNVMREHNLYYNFDADSSGHEVISLLKVDSLLVFECNRELKRFLRHNAGGIWIIKIHLNPK
jgi:hypothetical protein